MLFTKKFLQENKWSWFDCRPHTLNLKFIQSYKMVAQKDKDNLRYFQGKFCIYSFRKRLHQIQVFLLPNLQFLWKLHLAGKMLLLKIYLYEMVLKFGIFLISDCFVFYRIWHIFVFDAEDLKGYEMIKGQWGYSIYVILQS